MGYREGKCVAQPAGMHTIGGVPRKVAEFLGLDEPEKFPGYCFRRSGASMVAESCGNFLPVKKNWWLEVLEGGRRIYRRLGKE